MSVMFVYFISVLSFFMKRKYLLLMLLILEFIVLSLYILLSMMLMVEKFDFYFLMVFIVMSVCEGVLGLSLLVSLIRSHGNDYFYSYSILW